MPPFSTAPPAWVRGMVVVCALFGSLASLVVGQSTSRSARAEPLPTPVQTLSALPSPAGPPPSIPLPPLGIDRVTLRDDRGRSIEVYPPVDGQAGAALVVFLHATCMDPQPVCDLFGGAGRNGTFLVCPSGNETCLGAPDWHGPGAAKSAFLSSALAKVERRFGPYVAHDDTLVAWSRGAFAARDILYADVESGAPPRFTSLVLIAADMSPDPVRLRKAGIRRVLFTAGDQDGSRTTMTRAATHLNAAGLPARYVSLGPIGHWLPDDLERLLEADLAWVRQP